MILVTGKNGQVGQALETLLKAKSEPYLALDRSDMDLSDPTHLVSTLEKMQPTAVINAAAYTNVEQAESNAELAHTINAVAPGILAQWCADQHATFVHYSTDYVFDGKKTSPWIETDPTNPLNEYGKSKLAGETLVLKNNPRAIIFRTSWVYAKSGNNFVNKIRQLAKEKDKLTIIHDQIGTPNSAGFIAEQTLNVLDRTQAIAPGVYHLSCEGTSTWFEFANFFLGEFASRGETFSAQTIAPVRTEDFPTKAKRPLYSVLSSEKLKTSLGTLSFSTWQECFLKEYF